MPVGLRETLGRGTFGRLLATLGQRRGNLDDHSQGTFFAGQLSPSRPRRLYQAVRFALPQKHAIGIILALTLTVATLNAVEPLVIKTVFDELTNHRAEILVLSIVALLWAAWHSCARVWTLPQTG